MYTPGNDLESSANPISAQRAKVWRGLRLAIILLLVGVLGWFGATLAAPSAFAATQNVTDCSSTSDNSGGGVGTLAYALAHYASGDTISFQCSGDIIIPVTINVANTLTFDATGYSVTLDGNNSVEILNVTSSGNLTINNLTITKGKNPTSNCTVYNSTSNCGGGLYNSGNLTITNTTFNSNSGTNGTGGGYGGAIYNNTGGIINSISNSTFSTNSASNGGAIYNNGTINNISNSTFSTNSATGGYGGAIDNYATINIISNATFSSNSAFYGGGAIENGNVSSSTITSIVNSTFNSNSTGSSGYGGAISNEFGTIVSILNTTFASNNGKFYGGAILNGGGNILNVTNSTFNSNLTSNYGGAIYNNANITLTNSTFYSNSASTNNGGAIYNQSNGSSSQFKLRNSLLAKGSGTGGNCAVGTGLYAPIDGGYNLADDSTCSFTATGSVNTASNLNVVALQNNGGPVQTIALLKNSTAINVAKANCPNTDARGMLRLNAPIGCDVGAYQSGIIGNGSNASLCTEAALTAALSAGGYIWIYCPPSTTITVTTAPDTSTNYRSINISTTLDASPSTGFTISGANTSGTATFQLFLVGSGINFTINTITLTKGKAVQGGGINNQGTFNVFNSTFSSNLALGSTGQGGAIYNTGTINTISNSTFISNSANSNSPYNSATGGAIYNAGTISTISNSTFNANLATSTSSFSPGQGWGGAIYNGSGSITIINTTFSANSANSGAAIYLSSGSINSKNSLFANRTSGGNCSSTITDSGYNFTDDSSCGFSTANHSQTFSSLNLGTLQNNGGTTQTILPQSGSPAIDAIPNGTNGCGTTITTDQRGIKRPQGSGCDVGAAEVVQKTLAKNGGDGQSQEEQLEYSLPLTVTLTDSNNNGVNGVVVTFSAPTILDNSGPTIEFANSLSTTITATTDVNGNASSGLFYANSYVGAVAVVASVSSGDLNSHVVKPLDAFTPVTFNLTNLTNPNAITALSVNATNLSFVASSNTAQSLQLKANSLTNWTSTISYGAGASDWLSLDKTSGTVVPLATQNIGVSVDNAAAKALASGTYTATVAFISTSNQHDKVTVNVSLQVGTSPAYTYYLPFLGNNAEGYSSYLVVQNVGQASANYSLKFYDTHGALLTTPTLQGACAILGIKAECIPANPFSNNQAGTGLITSDQPLNVLVAENTPLGGSAYVVPIGGSNNLIAPLILKNAYGDFNTRLTIFNGGTSATNVTVTFYDQNGNVVPSANQSQSVAANTTWTLDQSVTANLPDGFNGWATISAPTGSQLVAQVLEQSQSQKFVAIANAQPVSKAASTLYAPAIFNKAFGFVTGANIVNPNAVSVQISITYYDDSGKAYPTPSFSLKPNSVAAIYQGDNSAMLPNGFSGSALVKSSGGNVVMLVNESGGISASGAAMAGVYEAASSGSSTIGLPVMANGGYGYTTGATILNTSSNTVNGAIQYYNLDGTPQGIAQPFTIAPFASQLVYQGNAAQNLPSSSNGFYGTAIIAENGGGNDLIATANAESNLFYTYTEPSN